MANVRCNQCAVLHLPREDVPAAVAAEKRRGLWKNATVEQAVRITQDARSVGCECRCHG